MAETVSNGVSTPKYTAFCLFFFRRRPDQTIEQCWEHWRTAHATLCAPWLAHWGFLQYKQVEMQGKISPSALDKPDQRYDFDGIAVFEAPTEEILGQAFADPFWSDVVAADVKNFTDHDGLFQNGIIANFMGKMTTAVKDGKSVFGEEGAEGRRIWEEYQAKRKAGGST